MIVETMFSRAAGMPILPNTQFWPYPNLVQWIALYLWWTAIVVAFLFAGLAIWGGFFSPYPSDWLLSAAISVGTWIAGRGLLFLLTRR